MTTTNTTACDTFSPCVGNYACCVHAETTVGTMEHARATRQIDEDITIPVIMTPCQKYEQMVEEQDKEYPNVKYVSVDWDKMVEELLDEVSQRKLHGADREYRLARVRHCQQYINEFRTLLNKPPVPYSY